MTNGNERDLDPLRQAESILREAQQGKETNFSVELSSGILRKIVSHLSGKRWITRETNEESLLLVLLRKAIKVVVTDPQTGLRLQRGAVYPDIISISLNEREIDFLNELLLEDIQLDRELGRLDKEGEKLFPESYTLERIRSMQESTLRMLASTVSALRELNMAFIKAGGNSRPEIRQFFEG